MLNNRPLLIGIVVLLVLVKFVLLPVIEWQNNEVASLERQETQLVKGMRLLSNKAQVEKRLLETQELQQALSDALLANYATANAFQLSLQKRLDALLAKHAITARNSNWLTPVPEGFLEEHRIELSVTGDEKNFFAFLLDIEQQQPRIVVEQFSQAITSMKPKQQKLGQFNGRVVLSSLRNAGAGHSASNSNE